MGSWYADGHEKEPLVGIIASLGTLILCLVYQIFPEEKETPTVNNYTQVQYILSNLKEYQDQEKALKKDQILFNSISLENQEARLQLSESINEKQIILDNIKKAIVQAFEHISKLTISTDRLDQAKALFLEGDIPGALEILKDEAIQADYIALQTAKQSEEERYKRRMEEIAEKTKGIAEEWKMKAVLMATQYEDKDWFEKTKGYYEKVLEVDRDVKYVFEYAKFLQNHNHFHEATILYEEALQLYRSFASSDPEAFMPYIATTLNNLGVSHWRNNEVQKAQEKYEESMQLYRDLVKINPEAFMSYLAGTLNNLGNLHQSINELETAQRNYKEALEFHRTLVKSNPDVYLPAVAANLNNLANLHSLKNESELAKEKYEEALQIRRCLVKGNPVAFLPHLASTLNNFANLHRAENELEQAQEKYEEALQIRQNLANNNPNVFLVEVASTLNNLAILYIAKNEPKQAQKEYEEALKIYRTLAKNNPEAFQPGLANTASNMALFFQENQPDQKKSIELIKEALEAAIPFKNLKYAQDSIERAKAVINDWGLNVEEFLNEVNLPKDKE